MGSGLKSSAAAHKGSGLGLPLSRQLAILLDDKTWLESTLGESSTFYVEIPTAVKASAVAAEPTESEATILIIDDDEVSRHILRRTLVTLTSAQLFEASSLVEARRYLAASRPRIIFLDIVMPEENGLAFAEELRENEDTADLPTVRQLQTAQTRGRGLHPTPVPRLHQQGPGRRGRSACGFRARSSESGHERSSLIERGPLINHEKRPILYVDDTVEQR